MNKAARRHQGEKKSRTVGRFRCQGSSRPSRSEWQNSWTATATLRFDPAQNCSDHWAMVRCIESAGVSTENRAAQSGFRAVVLCRPCETKACSYHKNCCFGNRVLLRGTPTVGGLVTESGAKKKKRGGCLKNLRMASRLKRGFVSRSLMCEQPKENKQNASMHPRCGKR